MNSVPGSPFQRQYAAQQRDLDDAYRRVMRRGQFILGPELDAFERDFAAYCGTDHCVGVGNGLDALRLVLDALAIGEGDEVIVPGNTYIATLLAVSHVGAVPVPVEPRPDTFNIDPARIEEAITEKTKAIIVVHLFGQPAEMAPITQVAATHGLKLVEDAAQAHGAAYQGRRAGSLADAAAFSFYPTKNLGAFGDGGAVTTDDPELAEAVVRLRNYGSQSKNRHDVIGFNSRLDELQAAFLQVNLARLDESNATRAGLARHYDEALVGLGPRLALPEVARDTEPVWHQYVVRCDARDELQRFLAARSIPTLIHYPVPPHLQPAYAGAEPGLRPAALPITEQLARTSLSLPIHPYLMEAEQNQIIDAVREFHDGAAPRAGTGKARVRTTATAPPTLSKEARIRSYERSYLDDYDFEPKLVRARQDLILELLARERPGRVVEVGCGADMLATRAGEAGLFPAQWVIVEPSKAFAQRAREAATEVAPLTVVEGFFEDSIPELLDVTSGPVDMVLISGLLNELEDPLVVLRAARETLADIGLLHVNVPNAFSFHRRLAVAMGIIPDVHHPSERNIELAQFHLFDRESLQSTLRDAGFVPRDEGGYFLKPFTHAQMASIQELLSPAMLTGFWQLGRELPDLAAEIYVNATKAS
jgi:dTDP-4-amino-4,6-dideoxygalactose transaminase/SAM-dependent methyltransferase